MLQRSIDLRAALLGSVLIAVIAGLVVPMAVSRAGYFDPLAPPAQSTNVAAVGSAFNFQGRLEVDGLPADGTFDFEFRLFDEEVAGNQLPNPSILEEKTLTVTNGLFSTPLYFAENLFKGEARWVEVSARQGTADFVTLTPRQVLSPTPYALFSLKTTYSPSGGNRGTEDIAARSDHTHFGQAWVADLAGAAGLSLTNGDNEGIGLVAQGGGANGFLGYQGKIGVMGGVGGGTCSTVGTANLNVGVFGSTCFSSADSHGVRGYSLLGAGVYGEGGKIGVLGESLTSSASDGIGVLGASGATPSTGEKPINTGVYGYSLGTSSTGVYGRANGVDAVAVKGVAPTSNEFAGYFSGKVEVTGMLIAPSDIRLKRDLLPLAYGLEAIEALKPTTYHMIDDESRTTRLGFIAQDVREVIPELVYENGATGSLSLNYIELIPVLTKAIQEQQAEIEELEQRVGQPGEPGVDAAPKRSVARDWVMPGAVVLLGTGLFAVAWQLSRRPAAR